MNDKCFVPQSPVWQKLFTTSTGNVTAYGLNLDELDPPPFGFILALSVLCCW